MKYTLTQKLTAEFIGTFFLILIGCSAGIVAGPGLGIIGVALSFGFALAAAYYITAPISGGHLNPAISFAFWISKRMGLRESVYYALSQIGGAIGAGLVLYLIMRTRPDFNGGFFANGFALNSPAGYDMISSAIVEALFSAFFILTFLSTAQEKNSPHSGSIILAFTLAAGYCVAIPFTGGSLNPARSAGVALVQGGEAVSQLWFFFLMPLVGAVIAVVLERILKKK